MAKYTTDEFIKEYQYSKRTLQRLIADKKLVVNKDGDIDDTSEENRDICQKRRERLANIEKKKKKEETPKQSASPKGKKSGDELSLEIDILNAKLNDIKNRTELTNIKIQKEKREVVETSVLNKVIKYAFQEMMQSLTELPSVCSSEIIELVQAEKNPKEALVEYLTSNLTASIKTGLENARVAAKKYYED